MLFIYNNNYYIIKLNVIQSNNFFSQLSAKQFHARGTVVVPTHPAISDDDEEEDDDVADPDFVPPSHNLDIPSTSLSGRRKCIQPAVEVPEEEDEDEDEDEPAPQVKRYRKTADMPTTWHKVDPDNEALPE